MPVTAAAALRLYLAQVQVTRQWRRCATSRRSSQRGAFGGHLRARCEQNFWTLPGDFCAIARLVQIGGSLL